VCICYLQTNVQSLREQTNVFKKRNKQILPTIQQTKKQLKEQISKRKDNYISQKLH